MKLIITIVALFFIPLSNAATITECDKPECAQYFKKFYKYAKSGYADAMYAVGDMYSFGYGTSKDIDKAVRWYKKSARYGSSDGALKLGYLYLTNEEYNDYDDAVKYLKKAARIGNSHAAYTLASIFYDKDFGEYDLNESDKWLEIGFNSRSNKKTRNFIQNLYERGEINKNDFPKVYSLLESMNVQTEKVNVKLSDAIKEKPSIEWPKDSKIEVIKVKAPTLEEALDYELIRYTRIQPEKHRVNTGSKLKGQTCEKNMSCSVMNKNMYSALGAEVNDLAISAVLASPEP